MGEPREVRWTWESKDTDVRVGYMAVDGRMSIADLIAHMREIAPHAALEEIQVNWATVVWTRLATGDELAQRRQAHERWEKRHQEWERQTLARLIKKYGRWGRKSTSSNPSGGEHRG